jgi:hypothetical protein
MMMPARRVGGSKRGCRRRNSGFATAIRSSIFCQKTNIQETFKLSRIQKIWRGIVDTESDEECTRPSPSLVLFIRLGRRILGRKKSKDGRTYLWLRLCFCRTTLSCFSASCLSTSFGVSSRLFSYGLQSISRKKSNNVRPKHIWPCLQHP